jgi:hypothetical protein
LIFGIGMDRRGGSRTSACAVFPWCSLFGAGVSRGVKNVLISLVGTARFELATP